MGRIYKAERLIINYKITERLKNRIYHNTAAKKG
jgi:hypothetical protein